MRNNPKIKAKPKIKRLKKSNWKYVDVSYVVLPHAENLEKIGYKTEGAAGIDLLAAIPDKLILWSHGREIVPTGIKVSIPEGYDGEIVPRSGWATRGIVVANAPGTIDSDYRGEIQIILYNQSKSSIEINRGDRIAQLKIIPVVKANLVQVDELDETKRGNNGFGSTGY